MWEVVKLKPESESDSPFSNHSLNWCIRIFTARHQRRDDGGESKGQGSGVARVDGHGPRAQGSGWWLDRWHALSTSSRVIRLSHWSGRRPQPMPFHFGPARLGPSIIPARLSHLSLPACLARWKFIKFRYILFTPPFNRQNTALTHSSDIVKGVCSGRVPRVIFYFSNSSHRESVICPPGQAV